MQVVTEANIQAVTEAKRAAAKARTRVADWTEVSTRRSVTGSAGPKAGRSQLRQLLLK